MDGDVETKLVDDAINTLSEHFDSVQLFVSSHRGEDGTARIDKGRGNWFTRFGQVHEWIERQQEITRLKARKDYEDTP